MTTVEDPQGRRTVIDLVRGIRERIYPVGRLDYHSEGLVLLTNDGELAFKVSHPTHGSVKTYHVKVRGVPEERMIDKLRRGITIEGKRTLPCEIERLKTTGRNEDEGNSWFEVKLREGRTHQIRKMFQAVGHPVSKLRRVAIGPLSDPKLTPGVWRELTKQEVKQLASMKELKPKAIPKPRQPRRAPVTPSSRKKPSGAAKAKGSSSKKAAPRRTSSDKPTRKPAARKPAARTARTARRG
jgi:23S rRNA pseudouridine2605 synthase